MNFSDDPKSPLQRSNVVIFLGLATLAVGYWIYMTILHKDKLDLLSQIPEKAAIVSGHVVQLDLITGRDAARYSYTIDGVKYEESFQRALPCTYKVWSDTARKLLMNMALHVVVSNEDPTSSYVLLSPEEYQTAGLDYPDLLRDIYPKYIRCD